MVLAYGLTIVPLRNGPNFSHGIILDDVLNERRNVFSRSSRINLRSPSSQYLEKMYGSVSTLILAALWSGKLKFTKLKVYV
jgi:hypothetical protein